MSHRILRIGKPSPADELSEVKKAYKEGASINRIDEWFDVSNSGKSEYIFWGEHPVKRPRWTARSGYRIDRGCEWWVKNVFAQKIASMP